VRSCLLAAGRLCQLLNCVCGYSGAGHWLLMMLMHCANRTKQASILISIQIFRLYHMIFYYFYIYTRRITVLMFLEIALVIYLRPVLEHGIGKTQEIEESGCLDCRIGRT
jgi:hypothetical protein